MSIPSPGRQAPESAWPPTDLGAELPDQLAAEDRRDQALLRLMLGVTLALLATALLVAWH